MSLVKTIRDKFAIRSFNRKYSETAAHLYANVCDGTQAPSVINVLNKAFHNVCNPETLDLHTQFMDADDKIVAEATIRMPTSNYQLDEIALVLASRKLKNSVDWTKAKIKDGNFQTDKSSLNRYRTPAYTTDHMVEDLIETLKLRLKYDGLLCAVEQGKLVPKDPTTRSRIALPRKTQLEQDITTHLATRNHVVFDIEYH